MCQVAKIKKTQVVTPAESPPSFESLVAYKILVWGVQKFSDSGWRPFDRLTTLAVRTQISRRLDAEKVEIFSASTASKSGTKNLWSAARRAAAKESLSAYLKHALCWFRTKLRRSLVGLSLAAFTNLGHWPSSVCFTLGAHFIKNNCGDVPDWWHWVIA